MKYMVCGGAHFSAALMTIDELGTRLPGVHNKTWCPFPGGGALGTFPLRRLDQFAGRNIRRIYMLKGFFDHITVIIQAGVSGHLKVISLLCFPETSI